MTGKLSHMVVVLGLKTVMVLEDIRNLVVREPVNVKKGSCRKAIWAMQAIFRRSRSEFGLDGWMACELVATDFQSAARCEGARTGEEVRILAGA